MAEKMDIDELIKKEREAVLEKADRGVFDNLARGTGLAARSIGPIMAGGAAGAAMGAPIAGVGAIPGFVFGATAAGLAEPLANLGVSAYNYFTNKQQPTPSQTMDRMMTQAGLPEPETASERLASVATRAAVEAATGSRAANMVANALKPNTTGRYVSEVLAENPAVNIRVPYTKKNVGAVGTQELTAATTGAATQGLVEAGVPYPVALPLGMTAGVASTFRPGSWLPATGGSVRAENVSALKDAGIPLTPAQVSGNPFGRVMESVMRYLPTSAPRVARVEDEQMRAWTGNIMRQAGIDSDIATPEVLNKARQGFRNEYNTLERNTKLTGDEQLFNDLAGIENTYVRGINEVAPIWERLRDTVLNYAAGKAGDGIDYHRLQSRISEELGRATRSDAPSAGYWAEALQGLQKSLANAMERSAPTPDLKNAWADVNRRYMVFSRIEDTMARAGAEKHNTGFLPPNQIAGVESRRNPRKWVEGGDPFTDLVRAGAAVLPDPVPNSGTAQRTFAQDLLTGGKRGAPAAAAGGAAQAAGYSLVDPAISLGLPWLTARQWYAPELTATQKRLLGNRYIQSVHGASEADR